ncbi:U6 snRNA-associated Sm-like protein LSm7 [Nematocida sp. ERTm5]|nr:U6 snRNA-associated Sm-like protein LSm7 [Nematocida sp. ERTm5]
MQEDEKTSKRDQVFDLEKYLGKDIRICFFGGIEVTGCLLGYDQLLNLVLENGRMVSFFNPENELPDLKDLISQPPTSMMCKGISICSIDLMPTPDKAEEFSYGDNAYYTVEKAN